MTNESYWVLEQAALRAMLDRAHAGEDPGVILVELAANSHTEYVEGDAE